MTFCLVPVIAFLGVVTVSPSIVAMIDSLRELSLTVISNRGSLLGSIITGTFLVAMINFIKRSCIRAYSSLLWFLFNLYSV